MQTEAIRNIKIDKVTVWDKGEGASDGKTSTADFLSGMVKSLPPLHDVAQMAGLNLPQYLGSLGSAPIDVKNAKVVKEDKKVAATSKATKEESANKAE